MTLFVAVGNNYDDDDDDEQVLVEKKTRTNANSKINSRPVRTADSQCVFMIVYICDAQYSSEQF